MRSFLINARDGNVAMIFALCLIPLMLFMGGAVDLSRQRGSEVGAQNALDAALLSVAHQALDNDDQELTSKGREWFDAHMTNSKLDIQSFTIVKKGKVLEAEVVGTVDTTLLGLMGIDKLTVRRTAQVRFGVQKVEIALVLDTTGSMQEKVSGSGGSNGNSQTKLKAMQDAANDMMNALETASNGTGQLEVSLIPFATYVNVGPENANEGWIDRDGDSPMNADNIAEGVSRFDLYEHLGFEWKGCVQSRPHPHDVKDSAPKASRPETLFVPVFHPDEPDTWGNGEDYPNNYVDDASLLGLNLLGLSADDIELLQLLNPTKYGLPDSALTGVADELGLSTLFDNDGNGGNNNTGRVDCGGLDDGNNGWSNSPECDYTNPATWTPVSINPNYQWFSNQTTQIGPGFGCDMSPLTPLTSDFNKLRTQINALEAQGSTNMVEGVMWGWRALSPKKPFTEGDTYTKGTKKVLVLLSDGNNSIQTRQGQIGVTDYSSYGYLINERLDGTDEDSDQEEILDAMDDLTLEACTNIKAKGIRIITIRLDLTDDRSERVLSGCASSKDDFIDAKDAAELATAFALITDDLTQLYLSE